MVECSIAGGTEYRARMQPALQRASSGAAAWSVVQCAVWCCPGQARRPDGRTACELVYLRLEAACGSASGALPDGRLQSVAVR